MAAVAGMTILSPHARAHGLIRGPAAMAGAAHEVAEPTMRYSARIAEAAVIGAMRPARIAKIIEWKA